MSDKKVYLQAGQEGLRVDATGDYIFLKSAPGAIRVLVNENPTTMEPGAKIRVPKTEPGRAAFDSFQVDNLNQELAFPVVFDVGMGDYDQYIMSGDVYSETVLRAAAGAIRPDTRQGREFILFPNKLSTETYASGEVVQEETLRETGNIGQNYVFKGPNDEVWVAYKSAGDDGGAYDRGIWRYTKNLEEIGFFAGVNVDPDDDNGACDALGYVDGVGVVGLEGGRLYVLADQAGTTQSNGELANLPDKGLGMGFCGVSRSVVAYTSNGSIKFYDFVNQQTLADVDMSSGTQFPVVGFDGATGLVWVTTGTGGRVDAYDVSSFERVYETSDPDYPSGFENVGWALFGGLAITGFDLGPEIDTPFGVRKFALRDVTIKQSFIGVEKRSEAAAYLGKTKTTSSAASFTIFDTPNGPEIYGEVIRLALESYYGRRVASDYMDHVYAVRFGRDGAGFPTVNQGGGNRSLSLLKVADSFTVVAPSVVYIEHDSELQLEGFI